MTFVLFYVLMPVANTIMIWLLVSWVAGGNRYAGVFALLFAVPAYILQLMALGRMFDSTDGQVGLGPFVIFVVAFIVLAPVTTIVAIIRWRLSEKA